MRGVTAAPRPGPGRVEVHRGHDPRRMRAEAEAREAGLHIPLPHRYGWTQAADSWLLIARDAGGTPRCALGVQGIPSRSLPGHLLLRSTRFGGARSDAARADTLAALVDLARRTPRVLRVYLELFSTDEAILDGLGVEVAALGFERSRQPRCYRSTVLVDLTPSEADLLASFHATARRHIRAVDKNPVAVRAIEDPALARRLDGLLAETMSRTGGRPEPHDWPAIIDFSRREPHASRIVGLFRTDRGGDASLLAFAWGQNHGDTVEYATAASTRDDGVRLPMAYALAWDLMRWGKQVGARSFDFGGISPGSHGDGGDRLGGISDFKRYFTQHEARVGDEWILEPAPIRAAVARVVSAGSRWVGQARSWAPAVGSTERLRALLPPG